MCEDAIRNEGSHVDISVLNIFEQIMAEMDISIEITLEALNGNIDIFPILK